MTASTTFMGRACGKVILLGEHAVVFGIPAIAVGIDRGASAVATDEAGPSRLLVPEWDIDLAVDDDHDLARAFRALLQAAGRPGSVRVEARADLPPGGGLGCSAALGVAIARALDPAADAPLTASRAMAWERIFHGNPSGVDAAVAASGGCVLFEKGRDGLPNSIEPIRARGGLSLVIGHTGLASSTKPMVEAVARLRERRPEIVKKTFEGIHILVKNARLAIEDRDHFALGRLMDLNQMLLSGLFLSTPEIEQLCDLARVAGAHGAKLTGAGGGGSVVALVPGAAIGARVLEAWEKAGYSGFATRVAGSDVEVVAQAELAET